MLRSRPLGRRTPLRSSGKLATRKAIAKVSPRRKSQEGARRKVVAQVLERDGRCIPAALGLPGRCIGPLTAHELVKRSQMRDAHLDPSNCVASCWFHNSYIEDHPNEARELGLVKRREPRVLP